ncbi:MAG: O-antigen ligase family protein [Pseudomonadota bacterium]
MGARRKRQSRKMDPRAILAVMGTALTSRPLRLSCIPVLFALFAVFGGASGEGFNVHALLLLLCGAVSALAVLQLQYQDVPAPFKWLLAFLLGYIVLGSLHLIELPIQIWRLLGGREMIGDGWDIFGLAPSFEPISVAPRRTYFALVYVLIPLAAVFALLRLGWRSATAYLPWTISGVAAVSALLGLMQVTLPEGAGLYLYEFTNDGSPVGLFSNVNHHASFLIMSLAFTAVLIGELRSHERSKDADMAKRTMIGLCAGLQLIGILAAGSVAGYLLLVPMLVMCVLISQSQRKTFQISRLVLPALVLVPAILLVAYSPQLTGLGVTSLDNDGPTSRVGIAAIGFDVLKDHIWFGGGLGSFEPLFKAYEDPDTVGLKFANHAHNDYLQWVIETGLPGIALVSVFLFWLVRNIFSVWRSSGDRTVRMRRAASAALIIPLLHSIVDYPLRSPSILMFASICVVLMVLPNRALASQRPEPDRSKQIEL